ncbi:MAG TPA: hypothetical protein VNT32_01655 [Thermoleophilaceae bacterium]|nr:hypothetical protein [Thermoleophilaceae bacterium]
MRRPIRVSGAVQSDDFDDPLASVVNLFDIAMVLAVALVVYLVFATDQAGRLTGSEPERAPIPNPGASPAAPADGREVGRVLRLRDGSLVYTLEQDTGAGSAGGR